MVGKSQNDIAVPNIIHCSVLAGRSCAIFTDSI